MEKIDQKQVWDKIAEEWNEFKKKKDEAVVDFLKNQKGKILDFGSGSGRYLMNLKDSKMYEVDFSEEMIELAKKKNIDAEFFIEDATKLSFKDNFFDSAICIASLHCIETKQKREKAIKELYRVLKPGAKGFIGVWNIEAKRFKNSPKEKYINWTDKGKRYYYLYSEKEVHGLFKKIGFKVLKSEKKGMMIYFVVQKP